MDWKSHPIGVVHDIVTSYGKGLAFEFSVYRYFPLSTVDERRTFWLPAQEVTPDRIAMELGNLASGEELSFHSRVAGAARQLSHIPMIDFSGGLDSRKLRVLDEILPSELSDQLVIFHSGKSYHGYICRLLSESDWYKFCGLLLLMNFPDAEPIIDARWVGHRLRGGYSALRWSCNSDDHLNYPCRIGSLPELRLMNVETIESLSLASSGPKRSF